MKKQNRILKNQDFSKIIKTGKKIHQEDLSFYFIPKQQANYRIGITISKKVSKLAVVRNKIKRQISAIIMQLIDDNWNKDVVIIVKISARDKTYLDFEKQIKKFYNSVK